MRLCELSTRENVEGHPPGASSSRGNTEGIHIDTCNRVCLRRDFTQERAYLNDHDVAIHCAETTILSLSEIDLVALFVSLTERINVRKIEKMTRIAF